MIDSINIIPMPPRIKYRLVHAGKYWYAEYPFDASPGMQLDIPKGEFVIQSVDRGTDPVTLFLEKL